MKIYLIGTTQGPRLVRAESMAKAKKFIIDGYFGACRAATAEDMATINQEAGILIVEQEGQPAGAQAA